MATPVVALQALIDIFTLHASDLTIAEFVLALLEDSNLETHPCTQTLVKYSPNIIAALSRHSASSVFTWANDIVKKKYAESIKELTHNEEWHFNASHASAQDLDDFRIEEMALKMKMLAPDLWNILGLLLSGDQRSQQQNDLDGDQIMADPLAGNEDDLWEGLPEITMADDAETVDENGTFTRRDPKKKAARRDAICTIVCH
jgi:hypothetical protein